MTSTTSTDANAIDLTSVDWDATPTDVDELFARPFVDIDEERATPVPHRYVHGGFTGTETRFSFYLPPEQDYQGRFFQHVTPVPQSEHLAPTVTGAHNKIVFAARSGAYFVETNGGGPRAADPMSGIDPTIGAYRANAAAASFSRRVAQTAYTSDQRPYGYLYGGSGGAYRTIGAAESTTGVWDGFVPYVPGSPMAIPNVFSVRMHAQRVLRYVLDQVVEAHDAGGDPGALQLTAEEAEALAEVTRMGFPPRSWFAHRTMGMHAFSVLQPGVAAADPTYTDDFWSRPGYLGADPGASVHRDRVQLRTAVSELLGQAAPDGEQLTAGGVDESFLHTISSDGASGQVASAVRLTQRPGGWVLGAQLSILTGAAAGRVLRLSGVDGDVALLEPGQDDLVTGLAVDDEVVLDNSAFLAAQTYHRHQDPGPQYPVWDQFRDPDGTPRYPQRPMLLGPIFTQNASGALPTGRISEKVIVVACLLDREAFPWQADWYRARVSDHLGGAAEDTFRLWFIDNALHGDDEAQEFPDRTVSYLGALEAALRQLTAWVERGEAPADTTSYTVVDGQVLVPGDVHARGGVQPAVRLTVDGSAATTVSVGDPVAVRVEADAAAGGVVVELVTSLDGSGALGGPLPLSPARHVVREQTVTFDAPGTFFLAARASAQVDGAAADPHCRVQDLARARVTVRA